MPVRVRLGMQLSEPSRFPTLTPPTLTSDIRLDRPFLLGLIWADVLHLALSEADFSTYVPYVSLLQSHEFDRREPADMKISAAPLVLLASSVPFVLGHGQVHSVTTSYGTYAAADAYAAVDPTSPLRKLNTYGPAANFTGPDITCGPGGNTPVTPPAQADAGGLVTFDWEDWYSVHPGPVMTYIAECVGGCASFVGDTGNVWVKIDQDQYNPYRGDIPWGENVIRLETQVYSVHIPEGLKPGEYLLRHEILGLHVAYQVMGAQFYPNCLQLEIVNGGDETLPEGIPLPGSYDPYDPGILVNLYEITPAQSNYTAPGGPVVLPGGTGDWGNEAYGYLNTPPASAPITTATIPIATSSSAPSITSALIPTRRHPLLDCHLLEHYLLRSRTLVYRHSCSCGGQGWTGA
ncbi:hypothetical protein NM688_g2773 [Phlebia brevispora]|uniref:Uncharacterized protein n=1 Tax=Phlebia brevispora TaxID=194682 RepID=A0ACC1T7J9_9APHY|nr:hypothetical protein NM688_g2773 [Phlebia brevispora]